MLVAGKRHRHDLGIDVFTAARERMLYTYRNFDTVVVSWSGGKDSTSCLELAREAARITGKLPVQVMFMDEEVIYPETIDLVERHRADPELQIHWCCVPSIYRNACSEVEPDFIPFDPTKRDLWTHVPPPDAVWPAGFDENGLPKMTTWRVPPSIPKRITEVLFDTKTYGRIGEVLGLRTEESFVRYSGMLSSGNFITDEHHGRASVRPIYDWKARDVWLAIKENGWDYNRAYEKLWRAGGNPISTRVAPLFHAEAAMNLREVMLYWPDFWQLVRRRVRGAHAVAIYSGALHAIERYGNETWHDAAMRYWNNLGSEEDKRTLRSMVERRLSKHSLHSTEPLGDEKKCPECKLSWKRIARAIARGDRQGRILSPYKSMHINTQAVIYGE